MSRPLPIRKQFRRPIPLLVGGIAAVVLAIAAVGILRESAGPNDATGSMAATESPNPMVLTVAVRGETGIELALTIRDRSGLTVSARSATGDELRAHDAELSTANIVVRNLDDTHLLLIWLGSPCDRSATLDVDAQLRSIKLENGPRPKCDPVGNPRGVVFETREAVRGDRTEVEMR